MLDYLCIHVLVHCLVSNANITGLYEPRVGRYLERSFSLPFLGFFLYLHCVVLRLSSIKFYSEKVE